MARGMVKRKQKPIRRTKSDTYLANVKFLGLEPVFKSPLTISQYSEALSWYNYMCDIGESREYMETYLKARGRHDDIKSFRATPDNWVSTTACHVARLLDRGALLPSDGVKFIDKKLIESFTKIRDYTPKEDKKEIVKSSIQDKVRARSSDVIGEIEHQIDINPEFSLYDWLQSNQIPAIYCNDIILTYAEWLGELCEAEEGANKDLNEAYAHMTKKELEARIQFFNTLLDDAERYRDNTKKARAPRQKKIRIVPDEKILKNIKYQKEDKTFKLTSVNPEKILRSQEVWCFNTKYKTLTVFRGMSHDGISIKGTTVIKYDENTSITKRIGRKPEMYINTVLTGGKIALRKLMDEIKGDPIKLQNRINENTIILKAVGT